ncbi:non-specific serine/threonine protein kinase [Malassezia arunalokei]|uniref:non-specific serine/threonine protein kinase n=1 Tax=Malassezia arunalokei TaxID=1514897 RepID=A0AAJ6CLL8_9BASI|nr:non-specific serine/threonine protein kinase [Malassezia arunalokei]
MSHKRKAEDEEYDDYFVQKEQEESRLAELRKKRREKLAQLAPPVPPPVPPPIPVPEAPPCHAPETPAEPLDDMFDVDNTAWSGHEEAVKAPEQQAWSGAGDVGGAESAAGLHDNWDDPDGYYRVMLGEKLQQRYQIFAILGRGIFATVVRARDLQQNGREVAIKIARRQETMYKAGMKEISILRRLSEADPDNKMFIVHFFTHFEHRGHLCMVFESLGLNLRDIVKRFGKDVGLNLQAVKTYTKQMLLALALLREKQFVHADIKPDNILVNEAKTIAKLADFGSASTTSEMEITPYLVSRFYRAPEIILGQPHGCEMDMWSMACTIYELATGHILFPGKNNNHMLLLMQKLRGKPLVKQLKKCEFALQHFEDYHTFLSTEVDTTTGESIVRRVNTTHPTEDLRAKMLPGGTAKHMRPEELRQTHHLIDLLHRMLEWDPSKRITPLDALQHAFVQ